MSDEMSQNKLPGLGPLPVINHGERHLALVLLLDISKSLEGEAIDELNRSLVAFQKALQADERASGCAEIAIVTFNSEVDTPTNFVPVAEFNPPELKASGFTAMNEAIEVGLKTLEDRIAIYKSMGVTYFRPWVVLLTDGEATDSEREVAAKTALRSAIENNKVVFFPVAIGDDANIEKLREYYPVANENKVVLRGSTSDFPKVFTWLYRSSCAVVSSNPAVTSSVQLPSPQGLVVDLI